MTVVHWCPVQVRCELLNHHPKRKTTWLHNNFQEITPIVLLLISTDVHQDTCKLQSGFRSRGSCNEHVAVVQSCFRWSKRNEYSELCPFGMFCKTHNSYSRSKIGLQSDTMNSHRQFDCLDAAGKSGGNDEVFAFVRDWLALNNFWDEGRENVGLREAHESSEAVCLRSIGFCFGELGDLEEAHDMRAEKYLRNDIFWYYMHSWHTCNSYLHDFHISCFVHLNLVKWVDHDCSCVSSWAMSGRHHLTPQSSIYRPWNTTVQPKPFLKPRNLLGHQLMQDGSWVENDMELRNYIKRHGRGEEKPWETAVKKHCLGDSMGILRLSLSGLVIVKGVF